MENLSSHGPSLSPNYSFTFKFEQGFDYHQKREWMAENWWTAFYWIALYMVVIFYGQSYMSTRQPFTLRKFLTVWNLGLAIFSIVGTMRTLPEMIHVIQNFGFQHSVCSPSYVENSRVSGYWTWLFTLSKVPELGDTVFIILRKQNLIFLHWYHHITVLLFTWYSYSEHISPGRWYICMNYLVHSLMYSYFALRALGFRVPKNIAMVITASQIIQMVLGCFITYYGYSLALRGEFCQISEGTAKLALAMYGSYFLLFAQFFYNSYFGTSKGHKRVASDSSSTCGDSIKSEEKTSSRKKVE